VPGNPIQDIRVMRQIRLVMKDGVRNDTRAVTVAS
jgi:hypothetical protein